MSFSVVQILAPGNKDIKHLLFYPTLASIQVHTCHQLLRPCILHPAPSRCACSLRPSLQRPHIHAGAVQVPQMAAPELDYVPCRRDWTSHSSWALA